MKLSAMGGVYFAILFSIVPPPVWAKEKAYARTYSERDSTLRGLAETVENNFGLAAELEATFVEAGKKGYKGKGNTAKKKCGTARSCDRDCDGVNRTGKKCGGTDCDDGDPTKVPGGEEVCGDGKDNNCDGNIDEMCDTTFDEFELPPEGTVDHCLPKCDNSGPERNCLTDVDCGGQCFRTGILLTESCFTDMDCHPNGVISYRKGYCLFIPGSCVSPMNPLSGDCAFTSPPTSVPTVSPESPLAEMEVEGLDSLTGREDAFELFEDTAAIHIVGFWNDLEEDVVVNAVHVHVVDATSSTALGRRILLSGSTW